MRRKEKEITNRSALEALLRRAKICRLALCDEGLPYLVPLNFGYQRDTLYFHSAGEGKKLDLIKKNNRVCFEIDVDHEIVESEKACEWTMKFRSIIGFGKASIIRKGTEKRAALEIIMGQYSDQCFTFDEKHVAMTTIIKVQIDRMTGKSSGY